MAEQGWGNPQPYNSRSKYHYFRGGRSLCGKWGLMGGDLEDSKHQHSDNCAACQKKKLAELEKEAAK
jgi:hypothetical protein